MIERTVLANGIRVVSERMPGAATASVGFWLAVGSRDELAPISGASHFLEHLLFKGTAERSARSIAEAMDAVGGEMNAYTTKEHTAYYTRLPAAQFGLGFELLADVIATPAFRAHEIEAERQVILEEILMSEDAPEDVVDTVLFDTLFPHHELGRDVLGDRDRIVAMSRDDIAGFFDTHYGASNLVVAVAGDLSHDEVVERTGARLGRLRVGSAPVRTAPKDAETATKAILRPTEQAHLALGWRSYSHSDPVRFAVIVANQILGGGLSSRLFQQVREERGLAYSVFSAPTSYSDAGALSIHASTAPARLSELVKVMDDVVAEIAADGVSEHEIEVARGYLAGSVVLGMESTGARMGRLATGESARGYVLPIEEYLDSVRSVTVEEVNSVLSHVLEGPRVSAVVGPVSDSDLR